MAVRRPGIGLGFQRFLQTRGREDDERPGFVRARSAGGETKGREKR